MLKTVFLGTPAIAVPFLEALVASSDCRAVVTNPDQPAGRNYAMRPPPVKEAALRLQKPLLQPERVSEEGFLETFRGFKPELGLVVAYGKLLPPTLLSVPKLGFLNVHFSLLPSYRGAAPIQWALIKGETQTGVSLFWLDAGMDTGPLLLQKKLLIEASDTADTLRDKLTVLGLEALQEGLDLVARNGRVETAQTGVPSLAPMLTKEDGRIRWNETAAQILNRVRGTTSWPGAFSSMSAGAKEHRLKVLDAQLFGASERGEPGTVVRLETGQGPVIMCGRGSLLLTRVQPEGKKPMSGWDFWQGARLSIGRKFNL